MLPFVAQTPPPSSMFKPFPKLPPLKNQDPKPYNPKNLKMIVGLVQAF